MSAHGAQMRGATSPPRRSQAVIPTAAARCSAETIAAQPWPGWQRPYSIWLASATISAPFWGSVDPAIPALVTEAMRALPVGVPKLMVSTVASGNVAPYVGPNDIAMMYSVTDVAGLNAISRKVIGNAAHAAAGMARWSTPTAASDKPGIGITSSARTTECVTQAAQASRGPLRALRLHATRPRAASRLEGKLAVPGSWPA